MVTVKFKNPETVSIKLFGNTYRAEDLNEGLYKKLISLSPAFADQFEVVEVPEKAIKEKVKKDEESK